MAAQVMEAVSRIRSPSVARDGFLLGAKQPRKVTAAMQDMHNPHVLALNLVKDGVVVHGKAAQAWPEVGALLPHARKRRKPVKAGGKFIRQTVGPRHAAALPGNVKPDVVQVGRRFR